MKYGAQSQQGGFWDVATTERNRKAIAKDAPTYGMPVKGKGMNKPLRVNRPMTTLSCVGTFADTSAKRAVRFTSAQRLTPKQMRRALRDAMKGA